ncbi:MAG: hypothetical protein IIB66_03910, partial [Proteobacteria bacterium]|nr:hypothetical protein [Pseudomonadota bacterium]
MRLRDLLGHIPGYGRWRGYALVIALVAAIEHFNVAWWGVSCGEEAIVRVWSLGIGTGDSSQVAWATDIPEIVAGICAGHLMYLSIFANPGGTHMFALIFGVLMPVIGFIVLMTLLFENLCKRVSRAIRQAGA